MLLTLDPGAFTGWARFDEGKLVACGLTSPARWFELTHMCETAPPYEPPDVVIEEPTIYVHGSRARPADIMSLQLKVGELKGRFAQVGCRVTLVQPRTWKRGVPKQIHHPRILKALTPAEWQLANGKRHDVIDAIGLGLYHLGRMK